MAKEKQIEVSTNPLSLLIGATNIEGQYFFKNEMSGGLYYWNWGYSDGFNNYSLTVTQPFVGYYLKPDKNGPFVRGGIFKMDIQMAGASGSLTGPTIGGGYNWLTKNGLSIHGGYELVLGGSATIGGQTFNAQVFSLGILRVGYRF